MRLTKKEIAECRNGFVGSSKINALCDMADELLRVERRCGPHERRTGPEDRMLSRTPLGNGGGMSPYRYYRISSEEWLSDRRHYPHDRRSKRDRLDREAYDQSVHIRDLRSICETLAKRIAALEGFNWHIPNTFTPSSFWRTSTKSMSIDERKGRRRIRSARITHDGKYVVDGIPRPGRRMATMDRRHFGASRGFVFDGTERRQVDRRQPPEVPKTGYRLGERRRHWVADRRSGGATNGTYMLDGVTYPGRRNGEDRRNAGAPTCVTSFLRDKQMVKDERKRQRRQCEPTGYASGPGHLPHYLSADNKWLVDSRRHDGKDRRNAK